MLAKNYNMPIKNIWEVRIGMQRAKSQEYLKNMLLTALFAAMIYVVTAFVKIPTHQGYIHVGDGIIYIAAALLPTPYAMAAGAIGGGLSDYLSGYAIWVLPTIIIKAMQASLFTSKKNNIVNKRNIIAVIFSAVVCIVGYYLAGGILYGNFGAALADVPTNLIQSVASAALFIFLGIVLDRMDFKKHI